MANIVLRSASHIGRYVGEPVIFMLEEVRMWSSLTMANIVLRSASHIGRYVGEPGIFMLEEVRMW